MGERLEKYEVPSWDQIYELCIRVVDQIERSKYKPEVLVAIARGGWIPGRILSDLLENPNIASVGVEYYTGVYETHPKPKITQPLSADVKGKKVLIIDDIADSGESLKLVKEHLIGRGAADIKICTLYYKPWSIVVPDFYVRETDAWVIFPHEIFETVKKIASKLRAKGKSELEIESELVRLGLKLSVVKRFVPRILRKGANV